MLEFDMGSHPKVQHDDTVKLELPMMIEPELEMAGDD
jgi:hypothetical protein